MPNKIKWAQKIDKAGDLKKKKAAEAEAQKEAMKQELKRIGEETRQNLARTKTGIHSKEKGFKRLSMTEVNTTNSDLKRVHTFLAK